MADTEQPEPPEQDTEQHDVEVDANAEPSPEPSDPHMFEPLDDDEDGRFLDPADRRRLDIERRRGRPFRDDEDAEGDPAPTFDQEGD